MIQQHWPKVAALMALIAIAAPAAIAQGRPVRLHANAPPGAVVNLPYSFSDNAGNVCRIFNNGWMQQQGNTPLYSQGAVLNVGGNQPNQPANQAHIDEKTDELVMENMPAGGVDVTRRILFDKDESLIRYIDIFHNGQNQDQKINASIQSSMNFGLTAVQFIADPKKKGQSIASVAQTGANQSALEIYAGKNAKVGPDLNWPQGNNTVTANFVLTVPAGKKIAILHIHKTVANQEAGIQYVENLKESQVLKSIPSAIRKLIVNFPNTADSIGDKELLRGDVLDVVELHSGDQFRGTLKETGFALQTFYGPINLPVENVVGLINVGQFRPRQLLVTSDGQIFGGRLKKETLDLQLSSGQITQIPLAQISRAGYRRRAGEPEEWTFDRPMLLMRTGERMNIKPPTSNIEVVTRYGKLSLPPASVAAVSFQNEENSIHELFMIDGSQFSGLVAADQFDVVLETGAQPVKVPASAIIKLQLSPKIPEADDLAPTVKLLNDDLLIASLTGKLGLETAFDTIALNAAEIRGITREKQSVQDVQVVLWDGTSLSGQLQEQELDCQLRSGIAIKVPVALLEEYTQPQPSPSAATLEKIKSIVTELSADDWKQRDRASAALISMGPVASSALKSLRTAQPPEAQKAIDIVLQKLEEQRKRDRR